MLKLMKYELCKWRVTLLALLAGLAGLEAGFLVGQMTDRPVLMVTCLSLIAFLAFAAFAYLTIAGIAGYSRELGDRSGYLIFMTPVRPLGIVLSKLLFVSLAGLAAMALFGGAAWLNFRHLIGRLDLDADTLDKMNMMLRFGLRTDATVQQILRMAGFVALSVLLELLVTVCTGFLSITLSATLLHNKKGFVKGLISVLLFAALTWGTGWVGQKVFYSAFSDLRATAEQELVRVLGWSALLNFGFCAVFTLASSWLLDHKIDL